MNNVFDNISEEKWLETLDPEEREMIEKINAQKEKTRKLNFERALEQDRRSAVFSFSGCDMDDIKDLARMKDSDVETVYMDYLAGNIALSEIKAVARGKGKRVRGVTIELLDELTPQAEKLSAMQSLNFEDAMVRLLDSKWGGDWGDPPHTSAIKDGKGPGPAGKMKISDFLHIIEQLEFKLALLSLTPAQKELVRTAINVLRKGAKAQLSDGSNAQMLSEDDKRAYHRYLDELLETSESDEERDIINVIKSAIN